MTRILAFFLVILPLALIAQTGRDSRNRIQEIDFTQAAADQLLDFSNADARTLQPLSPEDPVELSLRPGVLEFDHSTPFIAFSAAWEEADPDVENTRIYVSFSKDGQQWEPWEWVPADEHAVDIQHSFATGLVFREKSYQHYRIRISTNRQGEGVVVRKLLLNFFSPGEILPAEPGVEPAPAKMAEVLACDCRLPKFESRQDWRCPQGPTSPSFTTVTHLIVHHSAGTNVSNDWSAVVLAIWNLHVFTNGWADVGYNWLIDPNGKLYEGRGGGDNVLGAHFCGKNSGTMGVCMLGTFTNNQITNDARSKLAEILAWKACQLSLDPLGTGLHATTGFTIPFISGHRNGCSTECPGEQLYAILPLIRSAVKANIDACTAATPVANIPGLEYFRLAPNPLAGGEGFAELSLTASKKVRYAIFSTDGRRLATSPVQRLEGPNRIPLPELKDLPAGVYHIQFWVDRRVVTGKVIKL